MSDLYGSYKPLRNRLKKCDLGSGLLSCYHFIQYLDFDKPLPKNLSHPGLITKMDRWRLGLVQWEFEILIRELIINAPKRGGIPLVHWSDIAKLINCIKSIENDSWGKGERNPDDVLYELVRIAHRQFPWQAGFNQAFIARYHWLYRQPGLREAIHSDYGMSSTELFQLGLSLAGHFLSDPIANLPLDNLINKADPKAVINYVNRISIPLDELRERYQENAEYNINWPYTFNPLRETPIIRVDGNRAICPIPSFLIRRITSEIYFDLVKDQDAFSRSFGPAVQRLIGWAATHANANQHFSVLEEQRFGPKKARKDSVDWIISDGSGTLFVECKGARAKFKGISDLTDRQFIIAEFDRIREFAIQAYKTLKLALDGQYPHWKDNDLPKFVMVVTLEDWQSFGIHVERHVLEPLRQDLVAAGLEPNMIDRFPLSFCAVADFEAAIHVARSVGIATLLARKNEGEYHQWAMGTFLTNNFASDLEDFRASAFEAEWELMGTPLERD